MKWKDSDESLEAQVEAGGEYEEEYSPLRARKIDLGARLASILTRPGVWLIIAALAILVLISMFVGSGGDDSALHSGANQRLQQLESRVASLEKISESMKELQENQQTVQPLMVRLDRLESSIAKRISDLDKQFKQFKATRPSGGSSKGPPASAKKQSSKQVVKTHVVQKGDTLYSISKQFGLSLTQLMKLNKLSKGDAIYPGQKLTVRP